MAGIDVRVSAPFVLGDVPAVIDTDQGPVSLWLRGGCYRGEVPGRPRRLRLVETLPWSEASPPQLEDGAREGAPSGEVVDVTVLFEDGVEIPDGGTLACQISWGCCHHHFEDEIVRGKVVPREGTRFGSWEHIQCASLVGKDDGGARLAFGAIACEIDASTPLDVGGKELTFGQIIALAGDFYAHFDALAAHQVGWAWPPLGGLTGWIAGDYRQATLVSDPPGVPRAILGIVERDREARHSTAGEFAQLAFDAVRSDYPARRYLALASQNICHFASQPPTGVLDDRSNVARDVYLAYHARAIAMARAAHDQQLAQAQLKAAMACEAFGCHFLTDSFASGHIRVPRRELNDQFGILRGALRMANAMHGEDNHRGLWCVERGEHGKKKRTLWRAFGDGMLLTTPAQTHLARVQAAVRVSVAEVFAAFCDAPFAETAEALLPVVLAPGEGPGPSDLVEPEDADRTVRNHYPMFWCRADGQIARRDGGPDSAAYTVIATGEQTRFE